MNLIRGLIEDCWMQAVCFRTTAVRLPELPSHIKYNHQQNATYKDMLSLLFFLIDA